MFLRVRSASGRGRLGPAETRALRTWVISRRFPVKLFALAFRTVFAGLGRPFFRLHSVTLFAPVAVFDAPAFGGLAAHPRRPERGKKKTANDFRGLAVPELFAADLTEDDAIVLALGLPGGIVVAPLKILAAFPSGHFRRLSNGPYKYFTSTLQFCKVSQSVNLILKIF